MAAETGTINKAAFAEILFDCIRLAFVEKDYAAEFPRHGLATNTLSLRDAIKEKLGDAPILAPRAGE